MRIAAVPAVKHGARAGTARLEQVVAVTAFDCVTARVSLLKGETLA
jgi:hypothetical protein